MPQPSRLLELDGLLAFRFETRVVPGLERIRRVLAELGNPQLQYPSVLVLGTNGKGSTAAFLASLLTGMGLRVGLYTSPHLVRVEERIRVDGKPLPPGEMLAWLQRLARFPELSYFETLTAIAFAAFAENRVDIAVVEAGLGGRWDATNVKAHEVALLTNVGTDHQDWLGPTRAHIAAEKAAALRGAIAVFGEWDESLLGVIRGSAHPQTRLSAASDWVTVQPHVHEQPSMYPWVQAQAFGQEWQLQLPLAGQFQISNYRLALAGLAALHHQGIVPLPSREALVAGTLATRWPGRLEELVWEGRRFLLDGAHNLEAMAALTQTLSGAGSNGKLDLIFSCLSDKPLAAMARLLRPLINHVQVAPLSSPRARDVHELAQAFPGCRVAKSVPEALEAALPQRLTLVTGSLRLVGEALSFLRGDA